MACDKCINRHLPLPSLPSIRPSPFPSPLFHITTNTSTNSRPPLPANSNIIRMRPEQLVALNPLSRREAAINKLLGRKEPKHILEARQIVDEMAREKGCTVEDIVGNGWGVREEGESEGESEQEGGVQGSIYSSPAGRPEKRRRTGSHSIGDAGTEKGKGKKEVKVETPTKNNSKRAVREEEEEEEEEEGEVYQEMVNLVDLNDKENPLE